MATITANGAKGHHKFTLTVSEISTSTTNNTSTMNFSFVLSSIQTGWDWYGFGSKISYTVSINGTTYSGTIPSYDGTSSVTLKSGTQTVAHNSDGTKTMAYSFSVSDGAGQSYTCGNASASSSMTLTKIPRQATITSAPNFNDEANPAITYNNPAGSAAATLQACISDSAGSTIYVPYRDISKTGTSYTFSLSNSERTALRNACTGKSLAVRFYVKTVIGGSTYYSYLARTLTIVNANPVISPSVVDTNGNTIGLTGDNTKLIKYYSIAKATMNVTPKKSASLDEDSYTIRNGNSTGYGAVHSFSNVESNVFIFSAADSRGNVGTARYITSMVNYVKLTCVMANNSPDGEGNMIVSCSGNYFSGNFGLTYNTLLVQYRYKESGGIFSSWTDMTATTSGNTYSAAASLTGLDYRKTYTFQTRAIDKLDTATSAQANVTGIPVFHWSKSDFVFEVPVTFNAGANGMSGQSSGIWIPTLNTSAISAYATQYGWYMKMGQVVTVGFFINATCNSGYNGTNISISGLPYTPAYSASGGGLCSGAYVAGGFNFQCYVAESTGYITTRIQACNATSAGNLTTSASACGYRYDGGEITLSGTITYMTNL